MKSFGIFDIVLPFLLVFTVVYGIFEKTKVFGAEGDKKNLNAMVAFVIGFFVVAATQIVDIMQAALPYIMLLLVLIIMFMVVFGATLAGGEINIWEHMGSSKMKGIFAFGLFMAIIAIVLGAIGSLQDLIDWIFLKFTGPVLSTIILLLVVGIFMYLVVGKSSSGSD